MLCSKHRDLAADQAAHMEQLTYQEMETGLVDQKSKKFSKAKSVEH